MNSIRSACQVLCSTVWLLNTYVICAARLDCIHGPVYLALEPDLWLMEIDMKQDNQPLDLFLSSLSEATQGAGGYVARCPAHDDRHPSLSVGEGDDGRVLLHCHAGCSPEAVVGAMGLTMADLFPRPGRKPRTKKKGKPSITLEDLAQNKALPIDFLESLGLYDLPDGGVGISYRDEAGDVVQVKHRTALVPTILKQRNVV